ncbi:MAG TPA: Ig-like domain-containing protein [Gemmatimonas sp.]|uniref:Ig-like domain-containing protein n=1 Tax=Gemmatimonas sp. TaxID=1962908 RepID=UPI002ED9E462
MITLRRVLPLAGVSLLAIGCTPEVRQLTGTGEISFPARMLLLSGDEQLGTVGEELGGALVVRVLDSASAPIAGQVVNFRVVAGGGQVYAGTAITDRDGRAAERWTLGTVVGDSQRVEARAVDPTTGERRVFATFRARASAGTPARLLRVTPDSQSATVGTPVVAAPAVRVTDRYGNLVVGAPVRFRVLSGGGRVSDSLPLSDSAGFAALREWRLGTAAGVNLVRASITDSAFVEFRAVATAAPTQPVLSFSTRSVLFTVSAGSGTSTIQSVHIVNAGGGILSGLSGSITYPTGQPTGWLEGGFEATSAPTNALFRVSPGSLPAGTYGATVEVIAPGALSSPQAIAITMVVTVTGGSATSCLAISGASVVADDGTFLGVLGSKGAVNSIFNEFGDYGSRYSRTSIFNEYGVYGGQYAAQSPFNPYSNRPPLLIKSGDVLAFLTVNSSKVPRVDPRTLSSCSF